MDNDDDIREIVDFLSYSGGWKGTKIIHDHLKEKGFKISRTKLLKILHFYAEPGQYASIDGIRQKTWIM